MLQNEIAVRSGPATSVLNMFGSFSTKSCITERITDLRFSRLWPHAVLSARCLPKFRRNMLLTCSGQKISRPASRLTLPLVFLYHIIPPRITSTLNLEPVVPSKTPLNISTRPHRVTSTYNRTVNFSLVLASAKLSVCPSARPHIREPLKYFHGIWYWRVLLNCVSI